MRAVYPDVQLVQNGQGALATNFAPGLGVDTRAVRKASSRELSQACGRMRCFDWRRSHREARPKWGLLARFTVRHRTVLASTV
jgi:hypothetical protein